MAGGWKERRIILKSYLLKIFIFFDGNLSMALFGRGEWGGDKLHKFTKYKKKLEIRDCEVVKPHPKSSRGNFIIKRETIFSSSLMSFPCFFLSFPWKWESSNCHCEDDIQLILNIIRGNLVILFIITKNQWLITFSLKKKDFLKLCRINYNGY